MMTTLLVETQYLPPTLVFAKLISDGRLTLEAHENYQKRSLRNRCYLAGSQGKQFLSIPLKKGKNKQLNIREVRISYDDPWISHHLLYIRSNYGKAPYFEHFYEDLIQAFQNHFEFLFDFNLHLIQWAANLLHIESDILLTGSYSQNHKTGISDWRNKLSVQTHWKSCNQKIPQYTQVFTDRHGFLPGLSILDLILCLGPEAKLYLAELADWINTQEKGP